MFSDAERAEVIEALRTRLHTSSAAARKATSHYGRQVAAMRVGLLESALGKLGAELAVEQPAKATDAQPEAASAPSAPVFGEGHED